jgi:transcriptional regulator with XRE-family HTH domain
LVGKPIANETGRALRRVRILKGLTLQNVGTSSGGEFKPTAVAGYERAERSISLERFCALCAFYGMAPDRLLGEIIDAVEREGVIFLADVDVPAVGVPTVDIPAVGVPDPSGM